MSILLVASAAALHFPSIAETLTDGDYPSWAMQSKASAGAAYHFKIDPKGTMIDCATMETIGDKRLALEICPILRRKHFSVGTLSDGTAVYAVANDMLRFIIPNSPQGAAVKASSAVPDLELTVSRLPNGQEAHATIVLAIDPSGIVTDCDGFGPKPNPALIKVACNQRSVFNGAIEYDGGGKPIPYVTIRKIEFRTATEVPDKNN